MKENYKVENGVGIIPEGVTEIEEYAFIGCVPLIGIVIPEGVTEIGEYAFIGCVSLTTIVIPNTIISIGENAFICCINLQHIYVPEESIDYYKSMRSLEPYADIISAYKK